MKFPPGCKELHYEVELGLVISKTGTDIPESEVMNHIGRLPRRDCFALIHHVAVS